jgi:hypothetical protein
VSFAAGKVSVAASTEGSGVKSRIARLRATKGMLAPRREAAKRTTPRPWLLFAAFRLGARMSSPRPRTLLEIERRIVGSLEGQRFGGLIEAPAKPVEVASPGLVP